MGATIGSEGHTLHEYAPPVEYVLSGQGSGCEDLMGQ